MLVTNPVTVALEQHLIPLGIDLGKRNPLDFCEEIQGLSVCYTLGDIGVFDFESGPLWCGKRGSNPQALTGTGF
jgi:hypothetical protein